MNLLEVRWLPSTSKFRFFSDLSTFRQHLYQLDNLKQFIHFQKFTVQAHDLTHITAQQSHHVWRAPRKTQVTSRRWSHITDIIFWKNSLRAPMNPANRIFIFFSVQIKKSLRARSSYAIFERNVCIIHSRLHWGAGFDRLVIYASIMAIYIGALVLTGGKLRINHSRLHWGAGFDRLIVYASIIAVYIGALALTGW